MIVHSDNRDMGSFLMHVFAFLILWEWLRPLANTAGMTQSSIFVWFIAISFTLLFFQAKLLISILIKLGFIFFMIQSHYYDGIIEDTSWLTSFISDFFHNLALVLQGNWEDLSSVFRTFLFFILLWFVCIFMHYWVIRQKRMLLFFVSTVLYVLSFHTFSPYDAKEAIMRTFVIGFFMLGLLHIERIEAMEKIQKYTKFTTMLTIPLIAAVVLSTTIGYFAPKASSQWTHPFTDLQGYSKEKETGGKTGMRKTGYDANDSQLGGPIADDDTVVFTAQAKKSHYWRIETKDFYTGKGWDTSKKPEKRSFRRENTIMSWYEPNTETETLEATVSMKKEYFHVIYPTGLLSIEASSNMLYSTNPFLEKIYPLKNDSAFALKKYKVSYKVPQFLVEDLKSVKEGEGLEANPSFIKTYTQLPDSLPARVRELAASITKGKTNRYDKAFAIETYFESSSFVYDKTNVAIPGENQDYVDQFLFDSKTGYCNNFSTSMIVLLRSIGIPSRWVKGYTGGTYVDTIDGSDERIYKITNNNAHSWVEVYFPGYGWVPFEPTKGFSNPYSFIDNPANNTPQTTETAAPRNQRSLQQSEEEKLKKLLEESEASSGDKNTKSKSSFRWLHFFIVLLLAALVGYVLFSIRIKMFYFLAILLYRFRKGDKVYFKAYNSLLKQLARTGHSRKESQTLREYAIYIDKIYSSADMRQLTLSFEKALYQKDSAASEWSNSVQLWHAVMKKASSRQKADSLDKVI